MSTVLTEICQYCTFGMLYTCTVGRFPWNSPAQCFLRRFFGAKGAARWAVIGIAAAAELLAIQTIVHWRFVRVLRVSAISATVFQCVFLNHADCWHSMLRRSVLLQF